MQHVRSDIHNSATPVLCQSCQSRHQGICSALSPEQLLALSRHTRRVHHDAGDELLADAEPITSYGNVLRGVVKLSKVLEDGRHQVVGLQFAPDLVGRLFAQESRVTAEAASDVDLCLVSKEAMEALVRENPALEHRLMLQTLRELDEARDWMVTLGRKTAAEKVASFLYLIASHIDRDDGIDRLLQRFPDLVRVDHQRLGNPGDQVSALDLHGQNLRQRVG